MNNHYGFSIKYYKEDIIFERNIIVRVLILIYIYIYISKEFHVLLTYFCV